MLKIKKLPVPGYEVVIHGVDEKAKLNAFIAVYSTALGPSLGGVRMFPFPTEETAIKDVLRLSKAMAYKAAVAGLKLGGGKAILIGDPRKDKTRELFLALGDLIESLKGKYIAAEDSGILAKDLDWVSERTKHVTGTSVGHGGSGTPAIATARGVLGGIQALVKEVLGAGDLSSLKVAIQGVGMVGWNLAKLLHKKGARLWVSDVFPERTQKAREELAAKVVTTDEIHKLKVDLFAPCAFGAVLNSKTIPEIQAKMIAGAANNQFENEQKDSLLLFKRGIAHAPDYVINAGGLINLYVRDILKESSIRPWLQNIPKNLLYIHKESQTSQKAPLEIANRLAEDRMEA